MHWLVLSMLAVYVAAVAPTPRTIVPSTLPASRPAGGLRVVTFNIRNSDADDGRDGWAFRRERFVAEVRKLDPDLLGCQEVLAQQQDDLVKALPDYDTVAVGRDDGGRRGEAASIFFRKGRFTPLDHGTFWLSPTPEKFGSVGWDAALTRICTWVVLRDRATGRELLAANTHFDHVGLVARANSAALIKTRLATLAQGRPIILTGDLNSTEDAPGYAALIAVPKDGNGLSLLDAYRLIHPHRDPDEATFHDFKVITQGSRIDYVFTTPDFTAAAAGIDRGRAKDGRFPSDHYPVWADFAWASTPTGTHK